MPSTTCEFGSGILGVYSDNENLAEDIADYFSSVGFVEVVDNEDALDGVMISAASGVGFILEIMQIWSEWLHEMGFEQESADEITRISFAGVSEMLKNTSKSFSQMQRDVSSKKGVTLAGLEMMRSANLDEVLNKGFAAAIKRSKELEKLL
jgi:pyrroline-5-carboxylate reductase